jgi:hypothetical protein
MLDLRSNLNHGERVTMEPQPANSVYAGLRLARRMDLSGDEGKPFAALVSVSWRILPF